MGNTNDILLNNWPVIQNFRDVVTGCSNQLYATLESLMVRLGTNERRQNGMVDVDNPLWILSQKLGRQNLHVTRKHNKVRLVLPQQCKDFLFCLLLIFF